MDGINTKKMVVNPEEAANIRLMFEMYAQAHNFLRGHYPVLCRTGDFVPWQRADTPRWRQMLRNPVYVQADLDVYEFFKSQGTVIVTDVVDFTGMNLIN